MNPFQTVVPENEECLADGDLDIKYYGGELKEIIGLMEESTYCYQDLEYKCTSDFSLDDLDGGWHDRDGKKVSFADTDVGKSIPNDYSSLTIKQSLWNLYLVRIQISFK